MKSKRKKALITGILGQDGAYLSKLLLEKDYDIYGLALGVPSPKDFINFELLNIDPETVKLIKFDDIRDCVQDGFEVYNFAGQSSVGESWKNPGFTFESNLDFYIRLLNEIKSKKVKVFQASSGEMYAPTSKALVEESPIDPLSPYALSKYSAYKYGQILRETENIFIINGILFNHESKLRDSRFVTRKIIDGVIAIASGTQNSIELGDIDIYRDWGLADEFVEAMWRLMQFEVPQDIILATGSSISLRQYIQIVFEYFNIANYESYIKVNKAFFRKNERSRVTVNPLKLNSMGIYLNCINKDNINKLIK